MDTIIQTRQDKASFPKSNKAVPDSMLHKLLLKIGGEKLAERAEYFDFPLTPTLSVTSEDDLFKQISRGYTLIVDDERTIDNPKISRWTSEGYPIIIVRRSYEAALLIEHLGLPVYLGLDYFLKGSETIMEFIYTLDDLLDGREVTKHGAPMLYTCHSDDASKYKEVHGAMRELVKKHLFLDGCTSF